MPFLPQCQNAFFQTLSLYLIGNTFRVATETSVHSIYTVQTVLCIGVTPAPSCPPLHVTLPKTALEPPFYLIGEICFPGGVLPAARSWPAQRGLSLDTGVALGPHYTRTESGPALPAPLTGPGPHSQGSCRAHRALRVTGQGGTRNVLLIQQKGKNPATVAKSMLHTSAHRTG